MSIFGGMTTEGLEDSQDRVGGFSPFDTDAYDVKIKVAYAGQSTAGAKSITFVFDAGGREYRETIYYTNRKGENFFLNKDDSTKKVPLPGFTTVNDICLVTTEKPLAEQATEEKVVKVWDTDAKAEVPKSVPVLVDLIDKELTLGIVKQLENKTEKQGHEYVPIAETRETNIIDKVFHGPTKGTVVEARNEQEAGTFFKTWVDRNKGNTRDRRSIKDGQAGTAGRPAATGGAPAAGQQTERKSLFGAQKA